ncbi:hypothetical protein T265_05202 [Opisthorchis viverrini]|uniref:Reverse transcriptase domain-containing protein n=1 Tax=Opisthorchis viverrini TaxID=6198 RepID=A0A074ZPV5_OPIVI|nr:hypothetical protein T265_05202 [Opisthorchis viverrini]KER27847.1 hypothetical protein T265_05202 [Opisthorchis viverrini]
MHFAPKKCKVMLLDTSIILQEGAHEVAGRFTYFRSYTCPDWSVADETSAVSRAQFRVPQTERWSTFDLKRGNEISATSLPGWSPGDLISAWLMTFMTSVLNTNASLPYNHDLFESLIVKKRIKTFTRAIWTETENKNTTDIGWQPYLVVSPTRHKCDENLADLEYADDIVLVFEEDEKAHVFLDELTEVIPSFRMHFAPTKCKVMLVDVQPLNTPLTIQGEAPEVVEHFTVADGVSARIFEARLAFAKLGHLWRQSGVSVNLDGRVYQATVRVALLYGCKTWLVRAAELRRLHVFDNRCLRIIARAC